MALQAADRPGKDRLIVALDVPTHEEAIDLVKALDNVSFFKIGLELFLAGDILGFIQEIQESRTGEGGVFIDLKISGDIGNTIERFIECCADLNVKFITLSESVVSASTVTTLQAAQRARGSRDYPRLLMVPLYSSLNADDLKEFGVQTDSAAHIVEHGRKMLNLGCDGLIVSGEAIGACRKEFSDCYIVSPGIRPTWTATNDHKRYATPTQAISYGADYLVVGRPIRQSPDPREAAQSIIREIDAAMKADHMQDDWIIKQELLPSMGS